MSQFIPNIMLSQLKALNAKQLKRLKSCEVTADGVYVFTFINPTTEFIRQSADRQGELSNSQPGLETIDEILGGTD